MLGLAALYGLVFGVSLLTFFSGFGLGTLLLPFMMFFFPPEIAIAYTAIIHFLNHLLRVVLLWKTVSLRTIMKFGIPAMIGSAVGACLLLYLADLSPIYSYSVLAITPVKCIIGVLLILIGFNSLTDCFKFETAIAKYTVLGGVISGFFGGLSGLQGAFRSYFLLNLGLDKYGFVATSAAIALLVDLVRLFVYVSSFPFKDIMTLEGIGVVAAALFGVMIGNISLEKIKMPFIQLLVAWLLIIFGFFLAIGLI